MSRVLALLGAVLLIAAAVAARAVLEDDADRSDGGDDDVLVVSCIPELRDACEAVDRSMQLTVEDPADTIARVAAGDDIDAWVTLDPWPAMAEIMDDRAPIGPVQRVAASGLLILYRSNAVAGDCADPVTWTCLVDLLGDAAVVPPVDSAFGRLAVGAAAEDFLPGFAANELRDDPQLQARLAELGVSRNGPLPYEDMLVLPDPDATAIASADYETSVANRPAAADLLTSRGATPASVAVVVAGPRADRVAGERSFTEALAGLGWTLDAGAATTGLPNAGVLVALREAVR